MSRRKSVTDTRSGDFLAAGKRSRTLSPLLAPRAKVREPTRNGGHQVFRSLGSGNRGARPSRMITPRRQGVGAKGCSEDGCCYERGARIWRGAKGREEKSEGIERGVPLVRRPRARALTDQMYVLQPDNGSSRTSSGSPAALLDPLEAIVSGAFSLGPLPPRYVQRSHMATYRAGKTEKESQVTKQRGETAARRTHELATPARRHASTRSVPPRGSLSTVDPRMSGRSKRCRASRRERENRVAHVFTFLDVATRRASTSHPSGSSRPNEEDQLLSSTVSPSRSFLTGSARIFCLRTDLGD